MKHRVPLFLLLAILVTFALVGERETAVGQDCAVRGAIIERGTNCTVGLLYQKPTQEADSAQAQEQLSLVWGKGKNLAEAYRQAEKKLPGQVRYELCDSLLMCRGTTLAELQALETLIAKNQCGRLAARVYCFAGTAEELQAAEDSAAVCEALYTAFRDFRTRAPRLYTVQTGRLLLPQLEVEDTAMMNDTMCFLSSDKVCSFTGDLAQLACLLQQGSGRLTLHTPDFQTVTVHAWLSLTCRGSEAQLQLYGCIAPGTQTPQQQAQLEAALQADCLAVWAMAADGQGDLPGTQAFCSLRRGVPCPPATQRSCRVHLFALG